MLAGRRVVVTRAAEQAPALAELLVAAGALPEVIPLVEIEPLPSGADSLRALDPTSFDWLVVTSPNGAAAYADVMGSAAPPGVAAVGTATAAALVDRGIEVDLVPAVQQARALVDAVPIGRVLVVQALDAAPALVDGLRARGAEVTAVTPYRTVPRQPTAREQLAALSADAVLFASGSAVRAWSAVFGTSVPPIVVVIGPQTAAVAAEVGIPVTSVAAHSSLEGLVDALRGVLDHR